MLPDQNPTITEVVEALYDAAGLQREDARKCAACRSPFSSENVFTEAGWREVSISGLCERCFDEIWEEEF